jgi:hypothetical protein
MAAGETGSGTAARAILLAGLIAGTMDITAACVYAWLAGGAPPARVFQSVATGVLGRASYDGGAQTAALGLFLHFVIATGAAATYYAVSRVMTILVSRPVLSGVLYGVIVWAFMRYVVIPLSAATRRPLELKGAAIMIAIHMACVGLPIALAVRRFGPAPRP